MMKRSSILNLTGTIGAAGLLASLYTVQTSHSDILGLQDQNYAVDATHNHTKKNIEYSAKKINLEYSTKEAYQELTDSGTKALFFLGLFTFAYRIKGDDQ